VDSMEDVKKFETWLIITAFAIGPMHGPHFNDSFQAYSET